MFSKLYPDIYVQSLQDVPLKSLKDKNIKGFILDLDNTITEWNSNEITEEVHQWFEQIKAEGLKACILSNNGEKRILQVAETLNIPYIHRAQKPRRGGYRRAITHMQIQAEETVVIGDQIFTDIWGGNRAGLYTILVVPLNYKEFMGTKFSRLLEALILPKIKKSMKFK